MISPACLDMLYVDKIYLRHPHVIIFNCATFLFLHWIDPILIIFTKDVQCTSSSCLSYLYGQTTNSKTDISGIITISSIDFRATRFTLYTLINNGAPRTHICSVWNSAIIIIDTVIKYSLTVHYNQMAKQYNQEVEQY